MSETLSGLKNGNRRYIYIGYVRPHFSNVGTVLRNAGGVKCQPFKKCSYHWKRALKMFLNGTVHFGFCLASSLLATALLLQRK